MVSATAVWNKITARDGNIAHTRELLLLLSGYFVYMFIRKVIIPGADEIGLENAVRVIDIEKAGGFFWELHFQHWATDVGKWLFVLFNYLYIVTYFPVLLTVALILYLVDRKRYSYYRSFIMLTLISALIIFAAFPLAPPRMMSQYGFIDSILLYGPAWYGSREATAYYNAFAAMPSLHFSWTVIYGVMFWRMRRWYFRLFGFLYPSMTFVAIVTTGNHYILDAVGGIGMVIIVYLFYERVIRTGALARAWATAATLLHRSD